MKVRIAKLAEKNALERLQHRASLNNPGDRLVLLENPDAIEIPDDQIEKGLIFVAEENESVYGFAGVLERSDGNIELDALFVEPSSWKRGVGRTLIDYCVAFSVKKGADSLYVVGNPHAEGFYSACGFTLIGTEKTRFGIGLLMKKVFR